MDKTNVLIVDDDSIILDSLCEFLSIEGYATQGAGSFTAAAAMLKKQSFSLVITDVNMPDGDGFDLLSMIRRDFPQTVVIIITGYGTIESAVEAIKKGAYDYLTKPVIDDELLLAVERAVKQQRLLSENKDLRNQLENKYSLESVISQDYKMAKIFELIDAVAETKTTILMTGDSGTGKSMLARAIHNRSSVANGPFVEVSCGALPETLLGSELFGHVKGAFTGAVNDKKGKFLAADGGTIFLDEIATASPAMQVKLLRVLQNREFEAVGSNETISVDCRVLLATNCDLAEEVKAGRFREDLYYRINVVAINLPALRDRTGDVSMLAESFLKHFCMMHNKQKVGISEDAMTTLERYEWPGNVRQLENVMERAVLLGKDDYVIAEDLPAHISAATDHQTLSAQTSMTLKQAVDSHEKVVLQGVLKACDFNRQETAKRLDINRTTLYKKMKKHGLENQAGK